MSAYEQSVAQSSTNPVYARFTPIKRVSVKDIRQMYDIFCRYYGFTDMDTFVSDMSKKSGVIMIRRKDTDRVVGFSTVVSMNMEIGRMKGRGIFSGDTIVEREYWGNRALQMAFFRYVLKEKLKRPMTPLFWLLISKGYKTYLLLANNFHYYYPHPENRYPQLEPIVRHYCEEMFPGCYDAERGVLDFGENAQFLKNEVAAITDDLRQRVPKIRYFEERNPTWTRGTELPCVGQVNMASMVAYVKKWLSSRMKSNKPVQLSDSGKVGSTS